jgi:hypothetical protein
MEATRDYAGVRGRAKLRSNMSKLQDSVELSRDLLADPTKKELGLLLLDVDEYGKYVKRPQEGAVHACE